MSDKNINTLVADIENVLLNGVENPPKSKIERFGQLVSETILRRLNQEKEPFRLRLSNIGSTCVRKLWLQKHRPEEKEPLRASTKLKFLYGDLVELLVLFLADLTGHDLKDQQKERNLYGIKGSSDVTIDGHLVDAKSASSYSFKKFKNHLKPEEDSFAYIPQLGGYHNSAQDDPEVTDKDKASFLVIDKQSGELTLDTHEFKHDDIDWEKSVAERVLAVDNPDVIPDRAYQPIEDGYKHKDTKQLIPNGNLKLDTVCSYCDMKFACHENIRIFLSSKGPVYMTHVVKEPKMKEISRKELETGETEESQTDSRGTET